MKKLSHLLLRIVALLPLALVSSLTMVLPLEAGGQSNQSAPFDVVIEVPQATFILGQTDSFPVAIKLKAHDDSIIFDCAATVQTSTGIITAEQTNRRNVFMFTYNLPDKFFPQYAIISATIQCTQGASGNWVVVPLLGTGEVLVKSKPFREVTLKIGKDQFGPVTTDARGRALVPIVVSPGIETGTVGSWVIDLKLPPVNRIAVITNKTTVTAQTGSASVWAYVVNKDGSPDAAARFKYTVKRGRMSPLKMVSPGVYRATYTPPSQVGKGKDKVSIFIQNEPTSQGELKYTLSSGIVTNVSATLSRNAYRAGEETPIFMDIQVRDKGGNRTDGEIHIAFDSGTVDGIKEIDAGDYRAILRLSDSFDGRTSATATISVTAPSHSNKVFKKTMTIALLPAPPIRLVPAPYGQIALQMDGRSTKKFEVFVEDAFGNHIRNLPLHTIAKYGGTTLRHSTDVPEHSITYTAPAPPIFNRSISEDTISVSINNSPDVAPLAIRTTLVNREYQIALSALIGYMGNFQNLNTIMFSLQSDVNLWFLLQGMYLSIGGSYYFDKEDNTELAINSTLYALPVYASIGYRFRVHTRFLMIGEVGAGPQFVWFKITGEDTPSVAMRDVTVGARGRMGVGVHMGRGELVGMVQYSISKSPNFPELKGDIGGLGIQAGYRFAF